MNDLEASLPSIVKPTPTPAVDAASSFDLEYIRRRLVEHDERLGEEEVLHVIEKAIQAEKSSKNASRLLTIGLLAAIPLALASFASTYVAIKLSNKDETPTIILEQEAIKQLIRESTLSDPISSLILSGDSLEEDDNFLLIGVVDLEDVEQAWLDAQKGLEVTVLAIDHEDEGNTVSSVTAIDVSGARLTSTADGDKIYSGLSTTGTDPVNFHVQCDSGKSTCDVLSDTLEGRKLCWDGDEGCACVIL